VTGSDHNGIMERTGHFIPRQGRADPGFLISVVIARALPHEFTLRRLLLRMPAGRPRHDGAHDAAFPAWDCPLRVPARVVLARAAPRTAEMVVEVSRCGCMS